MNTGVSQSLQYMWKFNEKKEVMPFIRIKSIQINTTSRSVLKVSVQQNVCGLRLARSQLMGEKKKVGKEERKKEERH